MNKKWKRQIKRIILKGVIQLPLSLLVKTSFQLSLSTKNSLTLSFHNEDFTFNETELLYELKTQNSPPFKQRIDSREKEYCSFINKLVASGFFEATADAHYEYDRLPKISYTYIYQLHFFWSFNGEKIDTLELIDDINYGLDEHNREKFNEFLSYMFLLVDRKNPTFA